MWAGNQEVDAAFFGLPETVRTLGQALGQDEVPTTDEKVASMTGEQFAWHVQYMLRSLDFLQRNLPAVADDARAFTMDRCMAESGAPAGSGLIYGAAWAMCRSRAANPQADIVDEAVQWVDNAVAWTTAHLGADWRVVGVEHKNAAAIAYRLGKLDPAVAQGWYSYVAGTVANSFGVMQREYQFEYSITGIESSQQDFLDVLLAIAKLPVDALNALLKLAGDWAAAILRTAGAAVGAAGEGLASGLWKAVKPLILPALLVGAAYVAWTMRYQIHAALTSAGRAPTLPRGGTEDDETAELKRRLLTEGTDGLGLGGSRRRR